MIKYQNKKNLYLHANAMFVLFLVDKNTSNIFLVDNLEWRFHSITCIYKYLFNSMTCHDHAIMTIKLLRYKRYKYSRTNTVTMIQKTLLLKDQHDNV